MNVFIQKLVSLFTDGATVTVCENIGLIVFLFNDPLFLDFSLVTTVSFINKICMQ